MPEGGGGGSSGGGGGEGGGCWVGGLGAWDKLCSITGRSFSLRQLNCGNSGSAVALVKASHPDVTGRHCGYSPEK